MVPTNSITVFIKHNDSDLRYLFNHICAKLKFAGSFDDLIQDFYFRLLTTDILQKYNRHFTTSKRFVSCRLSSYLFSIIRNYVISIMKSPEYRQVTGKVSNYDDRAKEYLDMDELIDGNISEECLEVIDYNASSDSCDGCGADLKLFYESFKDTKRDKRFAKKKKRKTDIPEASLSELFLHIYEGYTNREIASMYGVSSMYIAYMKHQLAKNMMRYGFLPEKNMRNGNRKVPEMSVTD